MNEITVGTFTRTYEVLTHMTGDADTALTMMDHAEEHGQSPWINGVTVAFSPETLAYTIMWENGHGTPGPTDAHLQLIADFHAIVRADIAPSEEAIWEARARIGATDHPRGYRNQYGNE
jgi:hypothetical protein